MQSHHRVNSETIIQVGRGFFRTASNSKQESRYRKIVISTDNSSPCCSELFPEAKTGKNPPEQIVGRELAGDFGKRLLREAQLLRQQFPGAWFLESRLSLNKTRLCAADGVEMTPARHERAFPGGLEAHALFQMPVQIIQPFTGFGR